MPVHEFGGNWTTEKLERVRKYLVAYTAIFAKNPKARTLTTIYVDAFAGTGYRRHRSISSGRVLLFPDLADAENDAFLKGSAPLALEVEPGFDGYLFIEKDADRAKELENLKAKYPQKAPRIKVVQEDANCYLQRWCATVDWTKCRAVMFLDPYGMQVDWSLIQTIAQTRAIDLWLLFPLGVAVNRLLTKGEPPPSGWAQALTRILGTETWKETFYPRQTTPTLFGDQEVQTREADFEKIGQFFVNRLKTVFTKVAENPLPLENTHWRILGTCLCICYVLQRAIRRGRRPPSRSPSTF